MDKTCYKDDIAKMLQNINCYLEQIDFEFFLSAYTTIGSAGAIHYMKIMNDLKASEYAGLDEQIEPIPHLI